MAIGRVSTYQLNKSFTGQIGNTQAKFNKLSQQIQTGKKVSSITDDAAAARGIIKANAQLGDIDTYVANLKMADNELTQTDNTLKSVSDKLQEAYDLAMTVANGTTGKEQMEAYRQQLDSIIESVTALANTNYGDQYLFSGTRTTTPAYTKTDDGLTWNGNNEGRYALIGEDKTEQINFIGKDMFGSAKVTTDPATGAKTVTGEGAFKALYELKVALEKDDVDTNQARKTLDGINEGIVKVTAGRTKTGALGSQFEDLQTTYTNDTLNIKQLRSNLEDVDLPSAISDWYSSYQALQASYQMFSQTMNVSLLNYI